VPHAPWYIVPSQSSGYGLNALAFGRRFSVMCDSLGGVWLVFVFLRSCRLELNFCDLGPHRVRDVGQLCFPLVICTFGAFWAHVPRTCIIRLQTHRSHHMEAPPCGRWCFHVLCTCTIRRTCETIVVVCSHRALPFV
jgi:hypothetical protein